MKTMNKLIAIAMLLLVMSAALAQEQPSSGQEGTGATNLFGVDNFNPMSTAASGCGGVNFGQPAGSPIAVGDSPISIAADDLNLDGTLDLAMANADSNNVVILLSNGSGGFIRPADIPVSGNRPVAIAIGDFNQDGKPDLALSNYFSNNVNIFLGNGLGGFTEALGSPVAVGEKPVAIAIGDFNQDGKADLATANLFTNNVTILLGKGLGVFTQVVGSPVAVGTSPTSLVTGDFNTDGKADIAVANGDSNTVTILLGNGLGGFTQAPGFTVLVGQRPKAIVAGDFNGDSRADLATANYNSNTISVNLGNGLGGFELVSRSYNVGAGPNDLAIGDFDLDGKVDFAVANYNDNNMTILRGGRFGFFTQAAGSPIPAGTHPQSIVTGDFNRDGKADFATANFSSDNVTIQLNTCSAQPCSEANFSQTDGSPFSAGDNPFSVATEDFNRDGQPDLAMANERSNNVTVLLANRIGGFTQAAGSPVTVGASPQFITAGDFNLDGKADLATANYGSGSITILLGNGSGGFTGSSVVVEDGPRAITVADFNLDGRPDLATANFIDDNVSILLGNSSGGFVRSTVPAGDGPRAITAGDFNRDGKPDLATANFDSDNLTILLGNGSGGFTAAPGSPVVVGDRPNSVAAGDFNRDGRADLAVSNGNSNTVMILLGNGSGGFTPAPGPPIAIGEPGPATVADFNQDGKDDLAIFTGSNVFIFSGNGLGGFTEAAGSPIRTAESVSGIAVADFNQDGLPDFAVTEDNLNIVAVYLKTCALTPCLDTNFSALAPVSVTAGDSPTAIATADFNLDGATDMAIANFLSNTVSLRLSNGLGSFVGYQGPPPATGMNPSSIAAGDFNLDGNYDMAIANQASNNLTILLGNSNGVFTPAAGSPFAVGMLPQCVAVGDLNLDGKPDLVTANMNSNNITLLLGNGMGGFAPHSDSPIAVGTSPAYVAIGDLDGDLLPDLAVANLQSNNLTVLLNSGLDFFDFTPATGSPFATGTNPRSLAIGDFNSDGKRDLAVANFNSNNVTILLNNGMNSFTQAGGSPVSVGANPRSIAAGDFNRDGSTDLAVTNLNANSLSILVSNGLGGFSQAPGSPLATGSTPAFVVASDFLQDGKPDLAVANSNSDNVLVYFNSCTLAMPPTINCPQNIIASAEAGKCSASVAFTVSAGGTPAPTVTCKVGNTTITSPHTFAVGMTTVNCTASNGTPPDATCSFTVTVRDTQPPTVNCPANITAVTDKTACQASCQAVSFPPPVASDNCPGVTVVCNPPSGSCFPVGATSVTCTATDQAGNTAACSFTVTVFDVCLQDDNNPGTVLLFNSLTGDYRFCCNGVTYSGRGKATRQGCSYTLEHNTTDRRVLGKIDKAGFKGTANLQSPPGSLRCAISDRDTRNNSCTCQ
jgi:hypothetical protein